MTEAKKRWCTCINCMTSWHWTQDLFEKNTTCPACKSHVWVTDPDQDECRKIAKSMKRVMNQ